MERNEKTSGVHRFQMLALRVVAVILVVVSIREVWAGIYAYEGLRAYRGKNFRVASAALEQASRKRFLRQ